MILYLHILAGSISLITAIMSVVCAHQNHLTKSLTLSRATQAGIAATTLSGIALVFLTRLSLARVCISGLVFLAVVVIAELHRRRIVESAEG